MHNILTSGKYYLFSVLLHIIFILLLSVFVFAPLGETSLQAQDSQGGILRVSFNKSQIAGVAASSDLSQGMYEAESNAEKNIADPNKSSSSEKQSSILDKNHQGDFYESNIHNYETGPFKKAYLLSELQPVYPAYAVKRGIEGTVLVEASIDSSGRVSKTKIIISSNYDVLDKAAIRCVRRARFAPASYMGNSVSDTLRIAVNFYLKKDL